MLCCPNVTTISSKQQAPTTLMRISESPAARPLQGTSKAVREPNVENGGGSIATHDRHTPWVPLSGESNVENNGEHRDAPLTMDRSEHPVSRESLPAPDQVDPHASIRQTSYARSEQ